VSWTVEITPRFAKDVDALPGRVRRAVDAKLDQLTVDPFAVDITKMTGSATTWRVRVGDYRIIVEVDLTGQVAILLRVRHRREAYR
jgi:mRNA interferase RelE/StbE